MRDLTVKNDVVNYMRESTSEEDWNERCDAVKAANGNEYPGFWFMSIVMSGVAHEVATRWK